LRSAGTGSQIIAYGRGRAAAASGRRRMQTLDGPGLAPAGYRGLVLPHAGHSP